MIVNSAIKYEGDVFTGKRHPEIMKIIQETLGRQCYFSQEGQGFVNHRGEFLNREEAKTHAKNCDQIDPDFEGVLTSEDLWKDIK